MGATADRLGGPRDDQQRRVVERLRAAEGEPVDFEELLAIGIEHPAVVCYELELSGMPIVQRRESNRLLFSLAVEPTPRIAGEEHARRQPRRPPPPVAPARLGSSDRSGIWQVIERAERLLVRGAAVCRRARPSPRSARLVLLAAAVALIAVAPILLASSPSDRHSAAGSAHAVPSRPQAHAQPGSPGKRVPGQDAGSSEREGAPPVTGRLQARTPPVPVSPAAAAALETEGHQLLAAGRYSGAIDRLLGAIRASGQSLMQCREPGTEACLTFAYALYDLGRALRLDGDPNAAIPVLRQRLRIDNQRPVVRQELELARSAGA